MVAAKKAANAPANANAAANAGASATHKKANANANAAAKHPTVHKNAAGSKKAAAKPANAPGKPINAAKKLPDDVYNCRIGKFTKYRQECRKEIDAGGAKGAACKEVVRRCAKDGIGQIPELQVDTFLQKDDPASDATYQKIKDAGYNYGKARRCVSDIWWEINQQELLDECKGDLPGFLLKNKNAGRSKKGNAFPGNAAGAAAGAPGHTKKKNAAAAPNAAKNATVKNAAAKNAGKFGFF